MRPIKSSMLQTYQILSRRFWIQSMIYEENYIYHLKTDVYEPEARQAWIYYWPGAIFRLASIPIVIDLMLTEPQKSNWNENITKNAWYQL